MAKINHPTGLPVGTKAINIAAGGNHSVVLYEDGSVYACGCNDFGQLGRGNNRNNSANWTLAKMNHQNGLPAETKAINIAGGLFHSIVLYEDGSVYACGYNEYGQLGRGNNTNDSSNWTLAQMIKPSNLAPTTKAINIAGSGYHSIVLYEDGSVYACGRNNFGQLGRGNNTNNTNNSYNYTLANMLYNNNGTNTNFNIGSTATFTTIFFNPSAITKTYNGNTNLTLTPSMYEIYTYNPLQPTITINMYTATFNDKNVGTNKTLTLIINQLKDNKNNTNYLFVIPYTTSGNITAVSQYINKYTTLNMLSKLEVNKTNTAAYAVIGYRNTNILVSVLISNNN